MTDTNVQLVQDFLNCQINGHKEDMLCCLHENVSWSGPTIGEQRGKDPVEKIYDHYVEQLDFEKVGERQFIASGNHVVVIGESKLTQKSTQSSLNNRYAMVFEINDGKICACEVFEDTLGIRTLTQGLSTALT